MKSVLIIEDDNNILYSLGKIVYSVPYNLEVYTCTTLNEACQCMLEHTIDLFLIDIILDTSKPGDTSGLRLAERIRMIDKYKFTPIIFITSLEDSKCISYSTFHCYSFIEKPFDPVYVKNMVAECLEFPERLVPDKMLFFRKDGIIMAVKRKEIIYVESINHILYIHTIQNDVLKIPYVTILKFLEMVDSDKFVRCRRNTVVNYKYLKNIDLVNGIILLSGEHRVEIGLTYKNTIRMLCHDKGTDLHN